MQNPVEHKKRMANEPRGDVEVDDSVIDDNTDIRRGRQSTPANAILKKLLSKHMEHKLHSLHHLFTIQWRQHYQWLPILRTLSTSAALKTTVTST